MKKFLYWLGGYDYEVVLYGHHTKLIAPGIGLLIVFLMALWGGYHLGEKILESQSLALGFAFAFASLVCLVDMLILHGGKSTIMWFSRFALSLLIGIVVGTLTIMQIFDDEILSQKQSLRSEQVEKELSEIVVKIKTCEEAIAKADSSASSNHSLHKDAHAGNTSRSGETMNVYPCAIRQDQTPGVDCPSSSLCRSYYDKWQEQRGKKQEKENELAELKAEKSNLEKRAFTKAEIIHGNGVLQEVSMLVKFLNDGGAMAWVVAVLIWLIILFFDMSALFAKISLKHEEVKYDESANRYYHSSEYKNANLLKIQNKNEQKYNVEYEEKIRLENERNLIDLNYKENFKVRSERFQKLAEVKKQHADKLFEVLSKWYADYTYQFNKSLDEKQLEELIEKLKKLYPYDINFMKAVLTRLNEDFKSGKPISEQLVTDLLVMVCQKSSLKVTLSDALQYVENSDSNKYNKAKDFANHIIKSEITYCASSQEITEEGLKDCLSNANKVFVGGYEALKEILNQCLKYVRETSLEKIKDAHESVLIPMLYYNLFVNNNEIFNKLKNEVHVFNIKRLIEIDN